MDNHIAMDVNGSLTYFSKDQRGNIVAITDSNGNIIERYVYKVYGEHLVLNPDFTVKCDPLTSTDATSCVSTSPFLWGGSLYEEETDLYWMRNRYYHKEMKRFINQDPIGIWGDANNLGNGFAYVAGMVIEYSDPTGLKSIAFELTYNSAYDHYIDEGYDSETAHNMALADAGRADQAAESNFGKGAGEEFLNSVLEVAKYLSEFKIRDILDRMEEKELNNATSEEEKEKIRKKYKEIREKLAKEKKKKANEKKENEKKKKEKNDGWGSEDGNDDSDGWGSEDDTNDDESGGNEMPLDPDNSLDGVQKTFANNILNDMLLKKKGPAGDIDPDEEWIEYETDTGYGSRTIYVRNPYYIEEDPMRAQYWEYEDADGRKRRMRNPFAPPVVNKITRVGNALVLETDRVFYMPEVDPPVQ